MEEVLLRVGPAGVRRARHSDRWYPLRMSEPNDRAPRPPRVPPERRSHTRPNLRAWIAAALRVDPRAIEVERPTERRFVAVIAADVSAERRRELEADLARQMPPEEEIVIEVRRR